MTEDEARAWLDCVLGVSRETLSTLANYAKLVFEGQKEQNLVSASTLPSFWSRHLVDSAQLVLLAAGDSWLDVGSGAGMPGIVTAILTRAPTILVEPRAHRARFLQDCVDKLKLAHVTVVASTVQKLVHKPVDIITARAVAPLPSLIEMTVPFAHCRTTWLLPKGKTAQSELASLPRAWQGDWEARASVTDPESLILIGRNVRISGSP